MHRIDTKTAQKDKFGAGKNGFTRGNPQTGTPATDLDDDYFDMLQERLSAAWWRHPVPAWRRAARPATYRASRAAVKPQESVWRYQIGWHCANGSRKPSIGRSGKSQPGG